jgi:hypothetical protein
MKTKRVQLVEIVKVSGNNFGDQIIELKIDGKSVTHSNPEGEHVDVASFVNRYYKPVAVEYSGAASLNRLFG